MQSVFNQPKEAKSDNWLKSIFQPICKPTKTSGEFLYFLFWAILVEGV